MTTKDDIDFEKLDCCINELELLLLQLDETPCESFKARLGEFCKSGNVIFDMRRFCNQAIEFREGVFELLANTIAYLKSINALNDK